MEEFRRVADVCLSGKWLYHNLIRNTKGEQHEDFDNIQEVISSICCEIFVVTVLIDPVEIVKHEEEEALERLQI